MGKTLGAILTVGVAVAVNVIPGVGQAISGAILSSGIGSALGMTAAGALSFSFAASSFITTAITVAGLSSLGGILGLGPSAPKPDQSETAIKNSRPARVSAYGESRLYGSYVLYETNDDGMAVDVFAVHDGEIEALQQYYLGDDKVTVDPSTGAVFPLADGTYGKNGEIHLYSTTGLTPSTAMSGIINAVPTIWTSDHRGDGVVLLGATFKAVKSKNYLDVYPNGIPVASMAAKWQKCPDPYAEDPTNESEWTWTENPIRHLMHYMMVREGISYEYKIAPAIEYWKAASDICDSQINLKAGGTENLYRSCVAHKHVDSHASVKAAILQTCDGWLATNSDGAYIVYVGKYYTPTVSITPDDIISYEWNGVGVDDDEAVNEILCSYVSKDHDYNMVETDAWRNEDDITERGQIISDSFEPQVPSWRQSRWLAKRMMSRKNALYRGTVTTNVAGRVARGERYINLKLEEAGTIFYDGPVEITMVTRNMETGGVTFAWVAANPNIDDWNPVTEEGNPAAKGDRIVRQPLPTPVIEEAIAEFVGSSGYARIIINAGEYDRGDLTWYIRWKLSTDAVWSETEASDTDSGDDVILIIDSVPTDVSIDVAASYSSGNGTLSDWSATETVSTSTSGLASGPVTEVTSSGGAGVAEIAWRNPTTANFGYVRLYRNTTNTITGATQIGGDLLGSLGGHMVYDDTITAGTYYYFLRAYSINDVASAAIGTGAVIVT